MRLKFRRQSTQFTCKQTVQAIALNSLIGTDFSDLDIIANSDRGYLIHIGILDTANEIVHRKYKISSNPINYRWLSQGLLNYMKLHRKLPSYEEALESYRTLTILGAKNYEEKLLNDPTILVITVHTSYREPMTPEMAEESIRRNKQEVKDKLNHIEKARSDEATMHYYERVVRFLDEELLQPINYRFSISEENDFSGLIKLSDGLLAVKKIKKEDILSVTENGGVVAIGAKRNDVGQPDFLVWGGHEWAVDRIENNRIILLDTNYHTWGYEPEFVLPLTKIPYINVNGIHAIERIANEI